MLSDEERKAIKTLTNKRPSEQMLISGKMCVNVLINLIEKQSKEIEELKDKYSDEKIRNTVIKRYKEVIEKDYVSKDKIKAKIEIKKEEKENCRDGIEEKYLLREIYVLQSLLEKE